MTKALYLTTTTKIFFSAEISFQMALPNVSKCLYECTIWGLQNIAGSYVHPFFLGAYTHAIDMSRYVLRNDLSCSRSVGPNSCESQGTCLKLKIVGYHYTNSPSMGLKNPENDLF